MVVTPSDESASTILVMVGWLHSNDHSFHGGRWCGHLACVSAHVPENESVDFPDWASPSQAPEVETPGGDADV